MPEGPEIHIEADSIRKAIGGSACRYIQFYHEHLKPFEKELSDRMVESVEAYGKGLVISFEGDTHIFSHNQLYGKWYITTAGNYPKTSRSLRLEIQNDHKSALLYSASDIDVMDGESIKQHPYLSSIGPDVIRAEDTAPVLDQATSKSFRNRSFSALLLDQHFLAGVGNYLRSEILFHAGIHPSEKPSDLSDSKLIQFCKSAILISQRAYQNRGITNDDENVAAAKAEGLTRRHYRHFVFGREDKPCYSCGNIIRKDRMGGRRIYICETCQNIK